ncbi:hypothetical protein [Roseovarius nitratireducens]|uniref:hypothetical protein n=1 Tax=Roseovarius nitratireducens TaxID=2044597 RepID=UPI000CE2613D|nr:hypothetical protein [Roseovarius nitratireducens]
MQHTISLSGQSSEDLAHILMTLMIKLTTVEESIKLDNSPWNAEDVRKIANIALSEVSAALAILDLPKEELNRIHQMAKSDLGL